MTEQLKKGKLQGIALNSFQLQGDLYPLVDNGHGSFREDRSASPELKIYTNPVRVVKGKAKPKNTNDSNTPIVYEDIYLLLSDYDTIVDVRLEFEYEDMKFKVMKIEPLTKHGVIIEYQYELKDITRELVI